LLSEGIHIYGGPNGVGKSTLGNQFAKDHQIQFVNPDEIKIDQERMHGEVITSQQLFHVLDISIESAYQEDGIVIIESNLHDFDSFRFLHSYVRKFKTSFYCYFYYLDNIDELFRRVESRVKHMGHGVSREIIIERYKNSYHLIFQNRSLFDEIHFYDVTEYVPVKMFSWQKVGLTYINTEKNFNWSDQLIDQFLEFENL